VALPINAKVEATPNFLANLESINQFFLTQDADVADARFTKLKVDLREMIAVLAWSPAGGRPARFLMAKSAQARLKSEAVLRLAEEAGLPYLREYVVGQHIVLYAHAETEVVLLAVKHQRQLTYVAADLAEQ
jgi:plasmid stabilization system protein ParE